MFLFIVGRVQSIDVYTVGRVQRIDVYIVGRVQSVDVLSAEEVRNEKCKGCHRPVITCIFIQKDDLNYFSSN